MGGSNDDRSQSNVLLTHARVAHGLTQQELAEAVSTAHSRLFGSEAAIDANHVSKLERGVIARPNRRYREALRAVLHATTDTELGFSRPGNTGRSRSVSEPLRSATNAGSCLEIDLAHQALRESGLVGALQTLEVTADP